MKAEQSPSRFGALRISLPNNWTPRRYQRPAWDYLERGGKHAELVWHRRSGKDEIALHRTACAAFERAANYWHMLPEYAQARKAIWDAVNPHSGKRRIDEAFPQELRKATRHDVMQIEFKNGASWQVVGSDSYNKLVGSTPAGIVYSEWALANPSARAYLRPILAENGGWQIFIGTPRGKNHAYRTYEAAKKTPGAFAQSLSAPQTGVFTREQLEEERRAYIADYGEDQGNALYEQEYLVSFDAAILGAFYGREMRAVEDEGRVCAVDYERDLAVHLAYDLGRTDDTSIWWFQVMRGEIHVIDFHTSSGGDPDFYIDLIQSKPYKPGTHYLPHDARAKTLAAKGKSIEEMWWQAFGSKNVRIVPDVGVQSGIQAARRALARSYFAEDKCADGIDALKQYRREWDDEAKVFSMRPVHDWSSNPADAFRMLAVAWREEMAPKQPEPTRYPVDLTINELIRRQRERRLEAE